MSAFIYNYYMYRWYDYRYMFMHAICVACHWLGICEQGGGSTWILCSYGYICVTIHVLYYHYILFLIILQDVASV